MENANSARGEEFADEAEFAPAVPRADHHTIAGPLELAASLPALIGFVPTRSVFVIALRAEHGKDRMIATLRADLPAPDEARTCASVLTGYITNLRIDNLILIAVAPADETTRAILDDASEEFQRAHLDIAYRAAVPEITDGQILRCYDHPELGGALPEPASTPAAAAAIVNGGITYPSRDAAVAAARDRTRLAPHIDIDASSAALRALAVPSDDLALRPERLELLDNARHQAAHHQLPADRDYLLSLVAALQDRHLRDICLADYSAGVDDLWALLARSTPAPWRAAPLVMLAWFDYARGSHVTAVEYVDQARIADPHMQLADLLARAADAGLPPGMLRRFCDDAAREARAAITVRPI